MASSNQESAIATFIDELDPVIFLFGAGLTVTFISIFAFDPQLTADLMWGMNETMLGYINWFVLAVMFLLVVFLLFLIVSPWGTLRLGDDPPEFSYLSYFAMLYSMGSAAGVVFWGPVEALLHYSDVPPLYNASAESTEAMVLGIRYSIFHWSLTPLACFTTLGIAMGYFAYNYEGVPLRVSALLTPILGADNLDGKLAKSIDIVAVFATIGGVATSLGFMGSQFVTGLQYQWGIELGNAGIILVVTGMTLLFTISLVLGLHRGIRRLSNFNVSLLLFLIIVTFILGPTMFLLVLGTQAVGGMVSDFISMSLFTGAGAEGGTQWANDWTVFYWAWALSWSPFAGLFIARISRGRTLREIAFTGIIATSMASITWFVVVGGTAVWGQHAGLMEILNPVETHGEEVAGFVLFEAFPFGTVLMLLFLVLVTSFFVTSADSATLAVSMMTTGGKENPSKINRLLWGLLLGATASILMIIGGVEALQASAVITGGPFALVCLIAVIGLVKEFSSKHGPLLLQKETRLIGSTDDRSTRTSAMEADDD
jgi:glycine betaine transporter